MKLCGLTVLTLCSPMIGLPLQDGIYNGSIMDIDSLSDLHDRESAAYLATKAPLVRCCACAQSIALHARVAILMD